MNKEVRSITYRLYPNKEQELKMIHFLDCTRKAYNRLIEICKSFVEHHLPIPTHFDLNRMVTKIRKRDESMWGVHSNCFQSVAKRASIAFKTWAKKHKDGVGFPRFKSWKRFDSFTYNSKNYFSLTNKDEKRKKKRIRLGLIGLVKYSNPYIMKGECKTATVFRKKIGNHFEWFVNITFENDGYSKGVLNIDSFEEKKNVGIDLGLENLAVLSDGCIIPNDRTYKKKEKDFAKQNRRLTECEEETTEYQKQLGKLSHKYKKLRNHRKDLFHKITRRLTEKYRIICLEDLSINEMTDNSFKNMKKSFRDAGWGIFTDMIRYKAAEAGNDVIFVNPAYTSQLCSSCGTMVPKDLSIREHVCPHCGLIISRDQNAAINILNRGLGLQTLAGNSLKSHEGLNPERSIEKVG